MIKQNLTLSLPRETIRKAKILAARRGSPISGLLVEQIEILVGEDEAYERAQRQATTLLDEGFHLGERSLLAETTGMSDRGSSVPTS